MSEWDKIAGHNWAIENLRQAIQYDRTGHAYLITGPGQVGKTTLGRTFAQALNCEELRISRKPCGHCRACLLIGSDRHPDVRMVEPELSSRGIRSLKIDQIRELQQELNLTTSEAQYKLAILPNFDTANANAANAFLKTLEEPPRNVILILTASNSESLLATITSRCRLLTLRLLPISVVQRHLEEIGQTNESRAQLLAHLSGGRIGWAIKAAQDPSVMQVRNDHLSLLREIIAKSRVDRFLLAENLAKETEELSDMLRTWLTWWRDLILLKTAGSLEQSPARVRFNVITNVDKKGELKALSHRLSDQLVIRGLKSTNSALWQLERNVNTRLVLENLFLAYPTSK
jgi:DNA polymerase-3 subunit delta'